MVVILSPPTDVMRPDRQQHVGEQPVGQIARGIPSGGLIMRLGTLGLLITLAVGLGLCGPAGVATAPQPGKVYRLGFLALPSPPPQGQPRSHVFQPFWHEMRRLGWMEGQNLVMDERWADLQVERLPALATELVQVPVDL